MLGHYRVIDELGKGGMGYVFLAEDVKLRRAVALKVMNQRIASTPHSRRRFLHEARAMAAVHHDHVVTIFEVGESNNTPFMAMEMLQGCSLEAFNKTSPRLSYEEIIDFARQIARGLAAAHAKGIVHRDIKPANIWIQQGTRRIKILDFGLALASTPVDHLAGRGAVIGTPGYLSPEQARSEPLDDRSDLYSLGVVLYELCTGRLPIQAKSVPGQLISILAHRPTPIHEINPEIPQPLCDLIHRLLRKEPRSRPSSAAVLADELDRVEQECHAKSEVAQAINKLQMGLSQVVSKTTSESFFDTVEEIEPAFPDPLAAIPIPVTMVPRVPSPSKAGTVKAAPAWLQYWPFAAIGAAVLIALPVLTYAFSGRGRGDVAYVVGGDPSSGADSAAAEAPISDAAYSAPSQKPPAPQTGPASPAGADTPSPTAKETASPTGGEPNSKTTPKRGRGRDSQSAADSAPPPASTVAAPPEPASTSAATSAQPPSADLQPQSSPGPESAPAADADLPLELPWTGITTRDGRGADAMVQNGSTQKLGTKPSIGIASRNDVETNHSYLRFDLAGIEEVKSHVQSAGLVLSLVGSPEETIGSVVRVHGIDDVGLWPEQQLEWKNSFSAKGLDSLPLLAEMKISSENLIISGRRSEIRVTSPEFAKFLARCPKDTVTLVLSGSGPDAELLRFASRESQSGGNPPTLLVQAPKHAPTEVKEAKKNRK